MLRPGVAGCGGNAVKAVIDKPLAEFILLEH